MNGAESLIQTLVNNGVEVCFTNPGTSEMHFVAALDEVDGMRCVLCLFEGVVRVRQTATHGWQVNLPPPCCTWVRAWAMRWPISTMPARQACPWSTSLAIMPLTMYNMTRR